MSMRYLGGVITANSVTPTGSYQDSAAPGVWTTAQQLQLKAAGLWPLFGNVSPDAFIENLFSTYLYTGNGATQTITNGIDLAGEGGLVWTKIRSSADSHILEDTTRGVGKSLSSNNTLSQQNNSFTLQSFLSAGYTVAQDSTTGANGSTYASWTFRKQPKFFDVVTYTGDGVQPRAIAHSLGSTPGCVIVKNTSAGGGWYVYHVGANAPGYTAAESYILLNSTNAVTDNAAIWGNTAPSGTTFTVSTQLNQAGNTYVAYLFAHDAGGFGLSGNENVISCGSYTCVTYPGTVTVTLGYEPQWVMVKNATQASDWVIYDNMRGMPATGAVGFNTLAPNSAAEENGVTGEAPGISPTATGFIARAGLTAVSGSPGDKIIYIAIRRGPMAVPTLGTKVYGAVAYSGDGTTGRKLNYGFSPDLALYQQREGNASYMNMFFDRLRGDTRQIQSWKTSAEAGFGNATVGVHLTTGPSKTIDIGVNGAYINASGSTYIMQGFGRAPSFFDEVCYTAASPQVVMTIPHNLNAVPELMILKGRSVAVQWSVYSAAIGPTGLLRLNTTGAADTAPGRGAYWNSTAPTSSVFTVGLDGDVNDPTQTFVAYLFATCPGVSKVGSYTGTGTTLAINCGFTTGARFVLIKRTDSTGDWYVWDSARGIIAGNDPYLLLNSDAAEVTSTDYVDTSTAGFEISSTAPAAINASGGSYIFLAIS